ncbi:phosphotransferase system, phosphocarrier protein HPr [Lachnospiraceae bacterium KM106-2]|nr:phosphotransferase system, phosphocarrier protein HPr [Lachnospiraceae bacterium KM106-2]
MISEHIIVHNLKGIHLTPAGYLCKEAINYESHIAIRIGNKEVNAKSVLGVLSACIKNGQEIEIICNGSDEEKALHAIVKLIKNGLGEKVTQ